MATTINHAGEAPPLSRDRLTAIALLILTGLGLVVCALIAAPFVPAITWSLAIAVVTHPVHGWFARRIGSRELAAVLTVAVITIALLAPTVLIIMHVTQQASSGFERIQKQLESGEWEKKLETSPRVAAAYGQLKRYVDLNREIRGMSQGLQQRLSEWVRSTFWVATQLLLTLFLLFYLFRDHKQAVNALRKWLPLSGKEADEVIQRLRAMIHATIYGTLVVSSVQGLLGGTMFWILGLPTPLLWGVTMALVSIIPILGAFTVWVPASIVLLMQGEVVKALILALWGVLVVGLIDNLLYPVLVGKEMRIHTAVVFVAIIGGLIIFGASGLVLGPVTLASTLGLIDILKRRTFGNRSAQDPT